MRSQLGGDPRQRPRLTRKSGESGWFSLRPEARFPSGKKFDSFISLLRRRNTEDFIIAGYGRKRDAALVLRLDGCRQRTRTSGRISGVRHNGEDQSGGKLFRGEIHAAMQISRVGHSREGICVSERMPVPRPLHRLQVARRNPAEPLHPPSPMVFREIGRYRARIEEEE